MRKIFKKIFNVKNKSEKRNKKFFEKFSANNKITTKTDLNFSKITINIEGHSNEIIIGDNFQIDGNIVINGYCNNSKITFGDNFTCGSLAITLGQNHSNFGVIENVELEIGSNTSFGYNNKIFTFNSNNKIKIGNNCMIASDVTMWNTDAHPIYDLNKTRILNKVKNMIIGDNVWIAMKATILKNVFLSDGTIVGLGSVVTKSFNKKNCIIAGNLLR